MHNPHDAAAWLQLASLIGDPEREKYCLEQVLKIDPKNVEAQTRLEAILLSGKALLSTSEPMPSWREAHCPHVGLLDDPQTLAAYASVMNHCYRLKEPKPIKLEYQQQFCLTPGHQRCLVFQRGERAIAQSQRGKSDQQQSQGKPAIDRSTS